MKKLIVSAMAVLFLTTASAQKPKTDREIWLAFVDEMKPKAAARGDKNDAPKKKIDKDFVLLKIHGNLLSHTFDELRELEIDREKLKDKIEHARICGYPDNGDKDVANIDIKELEKITGYSKEHCEAIQRMHKNLLRREKLEQIGQASRSWPLGCHSDFPDHYACTLHVDKASFAAMHTRPITENEIAEMIDLGVWGSEEAIRRNYQGKSILDVALNMCQRTYWRTNCALVIVEGRENDANIGMKSIFISGGVIGFAYFNNGTCGDHVHNRIDNSWRTGLWGLVDLLAHEIGHNMNLAHDFPGQDRHDGVMSYRRRLKFEGFSPGGGDYRHPKDPSYDELTVKYFPKKLPDNHPLNPDLAFSENPNPPNPPSPPNPNPPQFPIGSTITLTVGSQVVLLEVKEVSGAPDGTLEQNIRDAVEEVPEYDRKKQHQNALSIIHMAVAKGLEDGSLTQDEAIKSLAGITTFILGDDVSKWAKVLAIAVTATTAEQIEQVANGLKSDENAIDPEVVKLIETLIALIKNERFKAIAELILAFIVALG